MGKPKIYLETTMFNFYFADDAPDKRDDTLRLFEEIKRGKYEPYTSAYVVDELNVAPTQKRDAMLELIAKYGVEILPEDGETRRLAEIYVREGIIPAKYTTDAVHIASTTVNELDFIVSYNFQHIVKRKTIELTKSVNIRENYREIGIYSPSEVLNNA